MTPPRLPYFPLLITCLSACLASVSAGASEPTLPQADKWHPWFEIGGYYNSRDDDGRGSLGTSRGELALFAPLMSGPRHLIFGHLTAKVFQDDAREGNLALGWRSMLRSGFNLGAWIGADVRNTEIDNRF